MDPRGPGRGQQESQAAGHMAPSGGPWRWSLRPMAWRRVPSPAWGVRVPEDGGTLGGASSWRQHQGGGPLPDGQGQRSRPACRGESSGPVRELGWDVFEN